MRLHSLSFWYWYRYSTFFVWWACTWGVQTSSLSEISKKIMVFNAEKWRNTKRPAGLPFSNHARHGDCLESHDFCSDTSVFSGWHGPSHVMCSWKEKILDIFIFWPFWTRLLQTLLARRAGVNTNLPGTPEQVGIFETSRQAFQSDRLSDFPNWKDDGCGMLKVFHTPTCLVVCRSRHLSHPTKSTGW